MGTKRKRGSIRQVSKKKSTWQVTIELPKDEMTNKRQRLFLKFQGTRQEAEKFKTQKLYEVDKNILIKPQKQKFADFLDYWIDIETNSLKESTVEEYKHYIDRHIKPALGNINIQELKPKQLQDFYHKELKNGRLDGTGGISKKTLQNIHRIIHRALQSALKWEMVNKNVADNVELPQPQKYNASVYTAEELIKLITRVRKTDIYIPVMITIYTGMRRGEVLGLTWNNIDLENKIIYIDKQLQTLKSGTKLVKPKTENSIRKIDISDTLVEILKRHRLEQNKYKMQLGKAYENNINAVCTYPSGKLFNPKRFSNKFAKFLSDNDLPKCRFHDLRHTHASLLLKDGVKDELVSSRLGHKSVSITKNIYRHIYKEEEQNVASEFDKLLNTNVS